MNTIKFKIYQELEGGYFDKDEQGWCTYRIEVTCENGVDVIYSKFFDANGSISEKQTLKGKITRIENNIVYITLENGYSLEYSLKENKLLKF